MRWLKCASLAAAGCHAAPDGFKVQLTVLSCRLPQLHCFCRKLQQDWSALACWRCRPALHPSPHALPVATEFTLFPLPLPPVTQPQILLALLLALTLICIPVQLVCNCLGCAPQQPPQGEGATAAGGADDATRASGGLTQVCVGSVGAGIGCWRAGTMLPDEIGLWI